MSIEIGPATRADFIRYFGHPPPEVWSGLSAKIGQLVVGVAGVTLRDGEWWAFLDAAPVLRSPVLFHRRALQYLNALDTDIKVLCDERFQRARVWLERLGFTETDEEQNGCKVWIRYVGI